MKKRVSLGTKMILSFVIAIAGSILICGLLTYSKSKSVLNNNMKLTSEQTLESALASLQTYEKTISLPVDLLTRKESIRTLEVEPGNYDKYIANVQDELVAACKVTSGAVKCHYVTASGKRISGWIEFDAEGKKLSMNSIEEGVNGEDYEWYINCQGRKSKVNAIFSYITKPYTDPDTGKEIITVCQEVKNKDVVQGVVAMDIDAAVIKEYVQNIKLLNTGFVMMVDGEGNIIINSDNNTFAQETVSNLEFWNPISEELSSLETQLAQLEEAGDEGQQILYCALPIR